MAEIIELYKTISDRDSEILKEIEEKDDFTSVVTESSLDSILAFDCDFRITIFNRTMEKRCGMSKETVIGKYYYDIFPESWTVPHIRSRLEEILKGVETTDQLDRVHVGGEEKIFRSTLTPLRQNGIIVGGLVIFRNVTHLQGVKEV